MISPLAFKLHETSPLITVPLYADDLLIIIKCPPAEAVVVILLAMQVLQMFTDHAGLHINHSKSALLLKGVWTDVQISQLIPTKLPSVDRCKCLGVFFGHVNEQTSYEPALQKALGRTFAMQSWALSFPGRVMLLKLWILPLLVFIARVVFPTDSVISTLKIVYNVALRLTSWNLTHDILALPRNERGYSLPQRKPSLIGNIPPFFSSTSRTRYYFLHPSLPILNVLYSYMGCHHEWQTSPFSKAKAQSAATWSGTELVCAAVQRGKH